MLPAKSIRRTLRGIVMDEMLSVAIAIQQGTYARKVEAQHGARCPSIVSGDLSATAGRDPLDVSYDSLGKLVL